MRAPAFTRYIGINYSGAETPTASLSLDPGVNRRELGREHEAREAEVPPGDHSREDRRPRSPRAPARS